MKSSKLMKGAIVATAAMLPLSQAAQAEVNISGWINEGLTFYDDGLGSDVVQTSDNGTTLGSRMTFSGSTDVPGGLTAGFEVIIEPNQSNNTPLIFSNQTATGAGSFDNATGHTIGVLGNSLNIGGAFGKITVGLQTMPTDNIAVLADPSLTLWSGISPVFRGNGFSLISANAASGFVVGDFLNCYTAEGLRGAGGIGIDCNGIYRNGVRYDLPAFGPVSVAVGYANDDIFDIAAKYNGQLGRLNAVLHVGYALNQGVSAANSGIYSEAENFQVQGGLMDPVTGLFGSVAYQLEDADLEAGGAGLDDSTDAYYIKAGIKKAWNALGDTAIYGEYGSYNDQFGVNGVAAGVTGSEVERIGFSVDQYFGSSLIIYGKYENLEVSTDGVNLNLDELDLFTLGATVFF